MRDSINSLASLIYKHILISCYVCGRDVLAPKISLTRQSMDRFAAQLPLSGQGLNQLHALLCNKLNAIFHASVAYY